MAKDEQSAMEVRTVRGDIASQDVDAVVSGASTALRMGAGVAGSLLAVAGPELAAAASEKAPIAVGEAVVTDGFDLDADYVVHAAATPDRGHRRATRETVRRATASALAAADRYDCRSVAIPPLGCGNGGLHVQDGAREIADVVVGTTRGSVEAVRLVADGQFEYEILDRAVEQVRETGGQTESVGR